MSDKDTTLKGIKTLFGKGPSKFVSSSSLDSAASQIESADYIRAENKNKDRVVPTVDFSNPENFARYGSAKEYYKTSVERIYKTYPYDGSKKEKVQWSLSSSYLDNYIFENEYPRTNGFISVSPLNGGLADSFINDPGTGDESYNLATSPQYISVKGGPNQASLPIYDQGLNKSTDFKNPEHKANFYDTANNRAKNITINGTTGNTVEFWFRSDGNLFTTRAIYDAWNSDGTNETQPGSASYGRMLLESRYETDAPANFVDSSLFHFTCHSGTTGAERVPLFPLSVIGTPVNDVFNHFAVVVKNVGNQLNIKSFLNGNIVDNLLTGSAVLEVTGASAGGINANIGAYRTYPTEYVKGAALGESPAITDFNGFGNLNASFDEFRVWKTARTHKEIGENWFTQVGAGTNTDTSNTSLGLYFKFNEGIVGEASVDQVVLDYSGRVSNGLYNNYASTSRSTGSAMVLASVAEREFKDPILYPDHPDVTSYKTDAMSKGEEWDYRNPTILFNTLPSWIQEGDNDNNTLFLTQIMASYFDTLHMQIEEMKKVKTIRYLSSSVDSTTKPFPMSQKLLTNAGFIAPEIFADADVISALEHKDNSRDFEKKLYDVKNYIYQNIYNNLTYINKSKGTQKAIRNLIRCFGVDEEVYKINMYADNAEYTLNNNFVDKTVRKTYADFNDITRNEATVYTYKNSSESNNLGFITGSTNISTGFDTQMAMTVEAEVVLPRKQDLGIPNAQDKFFLQLSSSLFGLHSAKKVADADQTITTWDSNDYANFQVYAVADTSKYDERSSKSVKFVLKSYNSALPELTSSLYLDQYQDTKWNFAVRVKPNGYPNAGSGITGSTGKAYDVEFEGISVVSDVVVNSFKATGSITNTAGKNFITQKKRLYVGAHRTNFTGSVREKSDVLVSSCRYWADDINSEELKFHAIDPSSYGLQNPEKNAYLFTRAYNKSIEVPRIKTLVSNWEFGTVTGSDSSGQFVAKDSSYTINQNEKFQFWGQDVENLLETNHDARGDFFEASSTDSVSREYLQAFKQQVPENINDSNMITVATTDDLAFTKNTLPIKYTFSLEKSMYQTISEEMINFFLASKTASSIENLIGDPINRYRMNYKSMEKIRNIFFNTIGNTPDLEKYLNFYKWIDGSVSEMVQQLVPASAKLTGVTNVVEDHALSRGGKYQSRFPTIENKLSDPESCTRGINELLYDWQHGHAPTPPHATGVQATTTITATATPTAGKQITLRQLLAGGSTNSVTFTVHNTTTSGNNFAKTGADHGLTNLKTLIDAAGIYTTSAVQNLGGGSYRLTITQNLKGVLGNTVVTSNIDNYTIAGAPSAAANGEFSGGVDKNQEDNCLWWNKKALRNEAGLSSGDAGVDSSRMMIHSASVQVLNRSLCSPIKLSTDRLALRQDLNKRQIIFAETPPATGENIAFNTATFSKPVTCDDTTKINPQFKFKPQFKVEGDAVGSRFQGQMVSPVVFYSSSAENPNEDPTGYFKTTQHLQDYYSETKDIPMQGPFTEQHVGGYQYRHTGLNIGVATTRQEGWYTTTSSVGGDTFFIVYNPSAIATGYPRAGYSRDHIAKSYVNIKNIKNVTSSNNPGLGTTNDLGSSIALGNYSHDYEIAQIPGRSINNRYFIENSGISIASVASGHISGLYDRAIPDRGQNKYVFVNRFSAPGGPETMGAGYLDAESESFSVYNALPFRNLSVRSPLRELLTKHSAYAGYDSVLGEPSASFHKTQRNGAKRLKINGEPDVGAHDGLGLDLVTGSTFDNAFIQHAIPQSDVQYAWITASALTTPFGYAQPNPANASMASTDITFVSQSQIGIWNNAGTRQFGINSYQVPENQFIAQDFSGMNKALKLVESQMAENTVQYEANTSFVSSFTALPLGGVGILNTGLLRANGPAGNPSWVQVRQSYNPIVRDMRKNNRISLLKSENTLISENIGNGSSKDVYIVSKSLQSYTEPPVTSKYKPIRNQFVLPNNLDETGENGQQIVIDSSYGNNLCYFTMTNTNGVKDILTSMTSIMGFNPLYAKQLYDRLKRIYIKNENNKALDPQSTIEDAVLFSYKEVVYPKESYTFLKKTRMREGYGEASGSSDFNRPLGSARTFWKDSTTNRLRSLGNALNSMGIPIDAGTFKTTSYENVIDLSCWPLDANYPMVEIAPTGGDGTIGSATSVGEGEGSLGLPSSITLKSLNGELSYNNWVYNLYRVPMQGLADSAASTLKSSSPTTASLSFEYPNFALSGNDPNQVSANYTMAHLNLIPNWTANITSSRNPWFDSYEEYSNDIRRIGKDYSIIPEFRISDHMSYYLRKGFEAGNSKFLDIIGTALSNTASAELPTSDSLNDEFFRIYSHSDFMKHFDVFRTDHTDSSLTKSGKLYPSKIKLRCKGIKKFLPYQGFYPALRTVQLGQMFSASYAPYLTGNYDGNASGDAEIANQQLSSLMQPFFAPGIMFNTIKSGIAVDWPVITGSIDAKTPLEISTGSAPVYGYRAAGLCNFDPDWRLPFEAIVAPNEYLPSIDKNNNETLANRPDASIYHMWPNYPTASLGQSNQARRYSTLVHYGSGSANNYVSGSEEFRNWFDLADQTRPSPNFAWKGEHDNKYNLAMNNFLASTIDFFLEEQQVTTFISKPQSQFKTMMSGTTYYMDVVLGKTEGFKMYEGPDNLFRASSYATGSTTAHTGTVGARGMHYGPNFASRKLETNMSSQQISILKQVADPGPAPYTPPYFYGTSVARIAVRPHALREMEPGDSDKFTLSEIFSSAELETVYVNKNENSNGVFQDAAGPSLRYYNTASAAYRNQMHLNSSLNLFERTGKAFVSYNPITGPGGIVTYKPVMVEDTSQGGNNENDVWVIESKFECPTLNFSGHDTSAFGDGSEQEKNATTGMWRTLGLIPENDEGIFLQIKDPYPQMSHVTDAAVKGSQGRSATNPITGVGETRGNARIDILGRAVGDRIARINTTGSLLDICGFETRTKRVGQVASSRTISEAIIAIPISRGGNKIPISKQSFDTQLANLDDSGVAVKAGELGSNSEIKETSITDMIKKMRKFVIPPHLDFLHNRDIDPFVMYMFEFKHKLSQNDLSMIWQNMMPDISVTAEESESVIEHSVVTGKDIEFFGTAPEELTADGTMANGQIFPDSMRWMIFKVKQRAKNNYLGMSVTQDTKKGFGLNSLDPNGELGQSGGQLTYSYNWPYDFCSLVELAKVENQIDFKPLRQAEETVAVETFNSHTTAASKDTKTSKQ